MEDVLAMDWGDSKPAKGSRVVFDLVMQSQPMGAFSIMGIDGVFGMGFDTITSNHMKSPLTSMIEV